QPRSVAAAPSMAASSRRTFFGSLILLGALLQLFAARIALADATICVHDVTGLSNAISTAGFSKVKTIIQLERGTYPLGAIYANFNSPVVFAGDYVPGTSCTQRGDSADLTIIDFGGPTSDARFGQQVGSPYALIKFDRLTLRNGRGLSLRSGKFAVPPYLGQGDYPGHITLVHTHITGFTGGGEDDDAAASFIFHNGKFQMIDVLIDNLSASSSCAVAILPWDPGNTRFNNVTMALSGNRDVCLDDTTESEDKNYEIDNTIIWPRDGGTSTLRGLS